MNWLSWCLKRSNSLSSSWDTVQILRWKLQWCTRLLRWHMYSITVLELTSVRCFLNLRSWCQILKHMTWSLTLLLYLDAYSEVTITLLVIWSSTRTTTLRFTRLFLRPLTMIIQRLFYLRPRVFSIIRPIFSFSFFYSFFAKLNFIMIFAFILLSFGSLSM